MSDKNLVNYSCVDRIAIIELSRPDKLNALNGALIAQLGETLRGFDGDAAADVAILRGQGRAFSAGADVQESQMRTREELENSVDPMGIGTVFSRLLADAANWKPVIACVHGYALGMALGLVLDCDLIVAEEGTRFQITETSRGLGGYRHWARLKARGAAAFADEVSLTGRLFTAAEALAAGVINRVAPNGEGIEAARELATMLAQNPPLSVRETVRIRRWHTDRLVREIAFQTEPVKLHLTEDFAEAVQAFAEKRAPRPFKAR
jgi:enoyl-CoA hydratase/carnithine racemase